MLAEQANRERRETAVRPSAGFGILAILICVIALEFISAGACLVRSAHADPVDFCYGYAICQ